MYISRCYFNSKDESFPIAGRMCFIGKLTLMLAFHKHTTFWISSRNRAFYSSTARCRVVILVFDGFLPQLLPFRVHFFPKLLCINLCCLGDVLLLELLLVCTCLDVRSIHEDYLRVDHPVIQCFVQNMRKNFLCQFFRKPFAERIAYCCEVWDFVQQSISQKPPVG